MIKILHTADVHLDSPLRSLALRSETLRARVHAATREAFTGLVDTALDEGVAALLIAGDLYDGSQRSAKTAAFVVGQLERLRAAGIAVFVIKGNHDAENPVTGEVALPDNTHVFDGRGGKLRLGDSDIWIHGVSFSGRHAPESLLGRFEAPVAGAVNIAMLHTSLAGAPGHDTYAPCSVAELAAMGFDYWALGHVHKRAVHGEAPFIVMPGTPQGRDIGEAGPKSATLIEIDAGRLGIRTVPSARVVFLPATIDATGIEEDGALRQRLEAGLRALAADLPEGAEGIVRLTLAGRTARHWQILRDAEVWAETAAGLAEATGRLWLEKLESALEPAAETGDGGAVDELGRLMGAIAAETGFATAALAEIEEVLGQLPPAERARLLPDPAAAEALARDLSGRGAALVLARMRGAAR